MVRGTAWKKQRHHREEPTYAKEQHAEVAKRKRLKKLAFSNNILSEARSKPTIFLNPSNTVINHHGKDIVKKSQRKIRFLFAFPGLIAPNRGGKIGEFKDLATKNPVLYLDFPQGRMKMLGTIVYPKNRYLTLLFSKGGKNAICEDYFDNMIVFSDAWWIGTRVENPAEARLNFPKELTEQQKVHYGFKGGAGAMSIQKPGILETRTECGEKLLHKAETDFSPVDYEDSVKDNIQVIPVRHSRGTARKTYKFAENSSADDSVKSGSDLSRYKETEAIKVETSKEVSLHSLSANIDGMDDVARTPTVEKDNQLASVAMSKELFGSISIYMAKNVAWRNSGSSVHTTISKLFKKEEKKDDGESDEDWVA